MHANCSQYHNTVVTPATCRCLNAGTPIQNDLSEFHAVFDLACPGLLGNLNLFRKTYEGPIQHGRDADATDKQVRITSGLAQATVQG